MWVGNGENQRAIPTPASGTKLVLKRSEQNSSTSILKFIAGTNFQKDKGNLGYIIFAALPLLTLSNILVASGTKCVQHR